MKTYQSLSKCGILKNRFAERIKFRFWTIASSPILGEFLNEALIPLRKAQIHFFSLQLKVAIRVDFHVYLYNMPRGSKLLISNP